MNLEIKAQEGCETFKLYKKHTQHPKSTSHVPKALKNVLCEVGVLTCMVGKSGRDCV